MKTCSIDGCDKIHRARGFCKKHYDGLVNHGDPLAVSIKRPDGTGSITSDGYLMLTTLDGVKRFEHVLIAEKALGHRLPLGAEVHHVNENRLDNSPSNLVICPDKAYHKLLHLRTKAIAACGNPDFRRCGYCKQYDAIWAMTHSKAKISGRYFHSACINTYQRQQNFLRSK